MHCGMFHRGDLRTAVSMATTALAQFRPGSYRTKPLRRRFPVTWAETWHSCFCGVMQYEHCCFFADHSGCQRGTISVYFRNVGSERAIGFGFVVDTMQGGCGFNFRLSGQFRTHEPPWTSEWKMTLNEKGCGP
ncbi:hypothetical protein DPX16_5572 [Anabarilius grahami]|uniref:Uncharacterized protein n=1 Tax=Anabarilius grahami TaxID=495550 RepID=A0A3N0Y9T5_ANAGA|nr:hypothetical protein DPX16_5572 [Anabarilius grahami]